MHFRCPAGHCYCFDYLVPLRYFHRSSPSSQTMQCCLHSGMKTESITNFEHFMNICCAVGILMEKTHPQAKLQEEDWLEIES